MKIVVPIMPKNLEEAQSIDISKFDEVDIIEWRADFLDKDDIMTVAPAIFEKFSGREIIFTIRTDKEGGNINLSDDDYVELLKNINAIYHPDYVDFEYFSHKEAFQQMLDFPNLVLSYHNFDETPENLMESFSELTALAPRVVKVAVMPQSKQDVLDLMNYTRGFKTLNPEQEYATMSMGKLGRVSRFAVDVFGASWSFASLDQASAPGQVQQMLDFPNLVLSYHNFDETPENLMESFSELTALAPRVVKVAVMPQSKQDVLDLMNYTRGFKTLNPEQEYATMSMGKLGRVSRFAVDVFGASWSFASLDQASAPGQVALADMKHIREVLDAD